jgi:hypothetical protein
MERNEARNVALEIICNREHLVNFPFDYKKGLANEIADAIILAILEEEPKEITALKLDMPTTITNYLTLKWGTLKSWDFTNSEKGKELLEEYQEIGSSFTAMGQHDTPRQKEIICELIDLCDGDTIYLNWDDENVSKERAKQYVIEYGSKRS